MKRFLTTAILAVSLILALPVAAQAPKGEVTVSKTVKITTPAAKVAVPASATQPVVAKEASTAPASQPTSTSTSTSTVTTTPQVTEWWKILIRYGLELIFSILGIVATVFVSVLMKKYGFETYSAKVNEILLKGTGYAEQLAANALKVPGAPIGSAAKLALALDFVIEKAKEYGLPDKGKEWWTKKVEGWLGAKKIASNGK
jgi:hypothetical protein